jgi:hypothetical protein
MSNATVLPVGTKVKRISNGATGEVMEGVDFRRIPPVTWFELQRHN